MDEKTFFERIDKHLAFAQEVYMALDEEPSYYSLFSIRANHWCGGDKIWVYVERAGILWLCDRCKDCGTI
jgi:hypothetical protein